MRQSLKQYLLAVFRWWWVILVFVIGDVGGIVLTVQQNWTVPLWVWAAIGIAGLFTAQFLAFHHIKIERDELQLKLDRINSAMPRISMAPVTRNDRFILEIRNLGRGGADFTAKARVVSGIPGPELYTMYWESVRDTKCHIDAGGLASILVAEKPRPIILLEVIKSHELALFKMGTSGEQTFSASTAVRAPCNKNGKEVVEVTLEAKCVVEVTVTSEPPLAEDFGTHRYALEIDHKQEEKLLFDEVPMPSKESALSE
jgi:hypothetical protein